MKWVKLLRRALALFLATMAIWLLFITGDAHATAQRLFLPPGNAPAADGGLGVWERLIARQSPYLQAGQVLVGQGGGKAAEPLPEPADPEETPLPSPSPTPTSEDDTPLPVTTPSAQHVIAQTLLPGADYPNAGGVFLYNRTSQAVDMDELSKAELHLTGTSIGPQILIIHTHATESYTQAGQDVYQESDPYRTTDDAHNVVRVGDEMAAAFAQAGLNVLHDRTLHDYPNYNGAYTRSRQTVEQYLEAYPSISVVLDVHRDAIMGENDTVYKVMADSEVAEDCAQVMLVVGTQEGGGSHPNWRENLAFAIAIERQLNQEKPTLARPIVLRKSHYNQQLSPGSLLVEVGTHGNTLQEAINAARAFAESAAPVLRELLP